MSGNATFLISFSLAAWLVICVIVAACIAVHEEHDGFIIPIFSGIGLWVASLSISYVLFLTVLGFIEMGKWLVETYT